MSILEPTVKFIIGGRGAPSLSRVKVGIEESTDDGATTPRTIVSRISQVKCALKCLFFFYHISLHNQPIFHCE